MIIFNILKIYSGDKVLSQNFVFNNYTISGRCPNVIYLPVSTISPSFSGWVVSRSMAL
jgi:hypothetical protein